VASDEDVTIALEQPPVAALPAAVEALRAWQGEGAPFQLHPGDLGWHWRFGAEATAAAVRTWSRDGQLLAVGLLEGTTLLRLTLSPDARQDEDLALCVGADLADPARGVVEAGRVALEVPADALVRRLLSAQGWQDDERWTPLRHDLDGPVEPPGLEVEVVGPERAQAWSDVVRSAFDGSTSTAERWTAMAGGVPFGDARSLVAYDGAGAPVAAATVWGAGAGRPGLLEPLGVHRDHRGRGYGRAISRAAVAALQELGSSSALVCTPSSNVAAVATYRSAGFSPLPEVGDLLRPR
jgi:ribosomal protein S18 acetylase RimI-like enzyme